MLKKNNGKKSAMPDHMSKMKMKESSSKEKSKSTTENTKKKSAQKPEPDFFAHAKKMQENVKNFTPYTKDVENMMKDSMKMPEFDQEKMLKAHRKNMEALNEANKMAVDVMRQITQMQGQFIRQTFEEIDEVIRENLALKNMTPQEQMAKNTQRVQGAVQRAMDHSNNISQVMIKSNQEMFKNVQNRFEEGMKEMQENLNKTKH